MILLPARGRKWHQPLQVTTNLKMRTKILIYCQTIAFFI